MSNGVDPPVTAVQIEAQVREQLAVPLADYHTAISVAYGFLGEIVDSGNRPDVSLSAKVQIMLAARLQADLRATDMLASVGYALQAMTTASTVREVAVAVMYIGGDDDRARDWANHEKERRSYPGDHKAALQEVLPRWLAADADDVQREYYVYTQLCWAKHANPILQREFGITLTPETAHIERQPNASDQTLWACQYAVANAVRPAVWAATVFAHCHYQADERDAFTERHVDVLNYIHNVMDRDGLSLPGQ